MRTSTFRKDLETSGSQGNVVAYVLATMNYDTNTITGTHSATHDDFSRNIDVHKVESFINGQLWKDVKPIKTETETLVAFERMINETIARCNTLANDPPSKSFADKMNEIIANIQTG